MSTSTINTAMILAAHGSNAPEAVALLESIAAPPIGKKILARLCTIYICGTLVAMNDKWLVMCDVESVAETGELKAGISTGAWRQSEAHPAGLNWISMGAVVDISIVGK
jgi:hypothetical protein